MKKLFMLVMTCCIWLSAVLGVMAADGGADADRMPALAAEEKANLTVSVTALDAEGKVEKLEGVTLELFQVADVKTDGGATDYTLLSDYKDTKIVIAGMTSTQSNEYAEKLLQVADTKKIAGKTAVTDKNGEVKFTDLKFGMYLVRQKENSGQTAMYLEMSPFLVAVPEIVKGTSNEWKYEVKAEPKIAIGRPVAVENGTGSITVTKKVALLDVNGNKPLIAADKTFYVGLFTDAKGTKLYGTNYVKPIHITNSSSASVTFEKLPLDTYYVFETDAKGAPIPVDTAINDGTEQYVCLFDNKQQKVDITVAQPYENALTNAYVELPKSFYMGATIDIYKYVKKNGKQIEAEDTFYAGVFTKDAAGNYALYKLVTLKQNDKVSVEVPLGGTGKGEVEYWIFETDEKGVRIDTDSFKYEVSGESSVKLNESKLNDKVEITNTIPDKSKNVKDDNDNNTSGYSDGGYGVKTGDDTPIMTYVLLLSGAVIVLLLLFVVRRMKKRN